jgi:serine/threonine protein phosphatase PrpC
MLIQHKNDPGIPSRHAPTRVPGDTEKGIHTKRPVLVLQVGTDLDPGLRRKHDPNEDTLFVTHGIIPSVSCVPTPFALFAVADGMGGHTHGQEASRLAVDALGRSVCGFLSSPQRRPDAFLPGLIEGVEAANQAVYQRNQGQRDTMGTTMTAALVIDTAAYVAHVGDSRCYLYRPSAGLSQITHDHSTVAALVDVNVIQPEDIYTHPMRNLIYRSLGEKATVEVDGSTVPLAAGDTLLLCSDGLWEMVRNLQIAAILSESAPDPFRTAHALIEAALAGGGEDNVSAINEVREVSCVWKPGGFKDLFRSCQSLALLGM